MEALSDVVEDVEWIRVDDASAAGKARRAAVAIAERLGFSEHRTGEVAIVASELGTNLVHHATDGNLVLRIRRRGHRAGLELVAIDSGPGMKNIDTRTCEGISSAGTLGIGLGAVRRLSSTFEGHSVVGRGTIMVATFWSADPSMPSPPVAALTRAMQGQQVCGDMWAARTDAGVVSILLADGLGHGEFAATASRRAVEAFATAVPSSGPAKMIESIHAALRSTRGAAVAVAQILPSTVRFAGAGNISAWIDDGLVRRGLASKPGIVGERISTLRDQEFPFDAHATLIMHSDGLTSKWTLDAYPGLRARSGTLVAATLMRDAAVRHDDASIVVAKAS